MARTNRPASRVQVAAPIGTSLSRSVSMCSVRSSTPCTSRGGATQTRCASVCAHQVNAVCSCTAHSASICMRAVRNRSTSSTKSIQPRLSAKQ